MRSSAEVLEGNRVKLSVEVDEEELAEAVDDTMRRLQREIRVPGFRPGKVPRRLLEARLGTEAIREEVIRNSLGEYYAQAVEEAALDTIASPVIDITAGEHGGPLAFDAVVEVRPHVSIAGYEGIEVSLPSPVATEEEVEARIDRLREQFAELKEVDRAAANGDVVTIDVSGTRGGDAADDLSTTDFVYELGSGMIGPGVDEKLHGTKAGDIVDVELPEAPQGPASLKILVKLVREKVLPDPTDEWAQEASEFETMEDLRNDVRRQLHSLRRLQASYLLRERAVEELCKLVSDEVPETLVAEELGRIEQSFESRLAERRVSRLEYLEATGQTEADLEADLRGQAASQVRADLALRALALAEQLEATDEDLAAEITVYAESVGRPVDVVARQFAESGALERLRSEIKNSKAVRWLVEHVTVLDEQGNPMDRALLQEDTEQASSSDTPTELTDSSETHEATEEDA